MQDTSSGVVFINLDYFFGKIYDFFHWLWSIFFGGHLGGILLVLLGLLTIGFLYVIFYTSIRMKEIATEEKKKREEKMVTVAPVVAPKHAKWQLIQAHMFSNSSAEWRMAIIEADTLLEELTLKIGLVGISLGDRLKNASQADFLNVQAAWEAHKVRNRIAHDGSDYELTQAEANRVIRMYEDVFKEFNYI